MTIREIDTAIILTRQYWRCAKDTYAVTKDRKIRQSLRIEMAQARLKIETLRYAKEVSR